MMPSLFNKTMNDLNNKKASIDDKVFVENSNVLEDIVDSSYSINTYRRKIILNDKNKTRIPHLPVYDDEETRAMTRKAIAKKQKEKDDHFQNLLKDVDSSMDTLHLINNNIKTIDLAKQQKYRRQFDDWNKNIHGQIQKRISKSLNNMNSKTLHKLKYDDYNKFLETSNRKANIFRDIIIESEYDPLEPNRRAIKVQLDKNIRDPTFLDQEKLKEESAMLNPNIKISLKSKLKQTLDPKLWASDKIKSVGFGFTDPSKPYVNTVKELHPLAKSSVVFDDYDFPIGPEALKNEMPRGKHVTPTKSTIHLN